MKIRNFDTDNRVFVIAEVGNNHEGDFVRAQEMIRQAARTGVDAVKFQTFDPEQYVTSSDTKRLAQLRRFQLSRKEILSLSELAQTNGLIFFSTPFDLESAGFLNSFQPLFKISSGDNTFWALIEAVAGFQKPALISTGLADLVLLDRLYQIWKEKAGGAELAFLHCVASYPVPTDEANVGAIATLRARYADVTVGYSDHTLGIEAASLSVAAGARIVEKHFTLDKHFSEFRDHQLSADPDEMANLVENVRRVSRLLGKGDKEPQPSEQESAVPIRRSLAAARDLASGAQIRAEDIQWLRPGTGIAPGDEEMLVGKKLSVAVRRGEIFSLGMIEKR